MEMVVPISPILLNLILQMVIRKIKVNPNGNTYHRLSQHHLLANDVSIIGQTAAAVKESFSELVAAELKLNQ